MEIECHRCETSMSLRLRKCWFHKGKITQQADTYGCELCGERVALWPEIDGAEILIEPHDKLMEPSVVKLDKRCVQEDFEIPLKE